MDTLIKVAEDFAADHLMLDILLILLATLSIILAMIVDLISGVRKARQNGHATTSTGYKKTCDKARKYFTPFITLVCIDLITCVIVPVPIFSMTWAAWCVFCEFKSVREKAWQKEEMRKAERTFDCLIKGSKEPIDLKTREGILRAVVTLVTQIDDEQKGGHHETN